MNQIKTYFKKRGAEKPQPNETYYLNASNGMFIGVRSDWVDAVVPVDQDLEFQIPTCNMKLPPPGREIFSPVVRFFHEIYQLYHSEAAVLLHFNMTDMSWAFTVPEQTASAAHVHYEMTDRLPGYRCVGTMHSHGHMNASHSHVDTRDEAEFDGLHITIGSLTKFPDFDMDAEILVRGHRFKVDPSKFPGITRIVGMMAWNNRCVLENFAAEANLMVQQEWIDKVKANTWQPRPLFGRRELDAVELTGIVGGAESEKEPIPSRARRRARDRLAAIREPLPKPPLTADTEMLDVLGVEHTHIYTGEEKEDET